MSSASRWYKNAKVALKNCLDAGGELRILQLKIREKERQGDERMRDAGKEGVRETHGRKQRKERKKERKKKGRRKEKGKGRRKEEEGNGRSSLAGRRPGAAAHGASQTQARKGASLAYIGFLEFWKRDFGE